MTKLLTVVTLISASLLTFLAGIFTVTADRFFPMNADTTVQLSLSDSNASREELLEVLRRWSAESSTNLYLQAPADEDLDSRYLYGIGAASPSGPYKVQTFLPWQESTLFPETAIGDRNLSASYAVQGIDPHEKLALTSYIADLGGEIWWTDRDWRLIALQSLVDSGAALALVTSGVLVITSVLIWVLSRARRYDLLFLAGLSSQEIVLQDVAILARRVIVPIFAMVLVALAIVLVVSGTSFAAQFSLPLLVGQGCLLIDVLAVWSLTVSVAWPTRQALARRDAPGAGFGAPTEGLRLLALAITALTLPFLVSGLVSTKEAANQANEWSRLDGWVSVRALSVNEELEAPTREAALDLAEMNQVAFSKALEFYSGPQRPNDGPPALSIIVTDQSFLDLMGIRSITSSDWRPADVTELSSGPAELLKNSLPLWLGSPATLDRTDVHLLRYQATEPLPAIDGVSGEMNFYEQPLVLVVDDAAQSLTGNMLLASLSTGNLLFGSAEEVRRSFDEHQASDVILSVDRAADGGMLRAQLLSQTLWLRWLSLGLVIAALASSTAVGAAVWARKMSRRIFVLRTAGYSWAWIGRRRLMWESASATGMTLVGAAFLLELGLSPWWVLLLPLLYLPLSVQLHAHALRRQFQSLVARGT